MCEASQAARRAQAHGICLLQATLLEWVRRAGSCRASSASAKRLVVRVAAEVTQGLPAASSTNPERNAPRRTGLAYDEDYRKEIAKVLPRKRKATSAHGVADIDGISSSTQLGWDLQICLTHQCATWRTFDGRDGVYITQEDAARTGNPAKDTVYFTMAHCSAQGCLGSVRPPQACDLEQRTAPSNHCNNFGVCNNWVQ